MSHLLFHTASTSPSRLCVCPSHQTMTHWFRASCRAHVFSCLVDVHHFGLKAGESIWIYVSVSSRIIFHSCGNPFKVSFWTKSVPAKPVSASFCSLCHYKLKVFAFLTRQAAVRHRSCHLQLTHVLCRLLFHSGSGISSFLLVIVLILDRNSNIWLCRLAVKQEKHFYL